jgi:hypothetical protein
MIERQSTTAYSLTTLANVGLRPDNIFLVNNEDQRTLLSRLITTGLVAGALFYLTARGCHFNDSGCFCVLLTHVCNSSESYTEAINLRVCFSP